MLKLSPLAVLLCFACTDQTASEPKPDGADTAIGGPSIDSADGPGLDTQGNDSGWADSGAKDSGAADTASGDSGTTDTGAAPEVDLDGDGFTVEDGDCNDMDSSLHPAREEVCDGIDNNCDGTIDEDATTLWFLDFDGDGHGTEAFTYDGCTPLDGYVAVSDDCDDTTIAAYPGGVEICDTIDNNCDGTIDEDVTETFFLDEDEDTFGDAGFTIEACSLPPGYSDNAEDCHDLDALIHPGADELCDGEDNNCNGETDEDSATDGLTFHRDADADGFGTPGDSTSACAAPDGFVADSSDCDDHDDDIHPDATEECDGEDNNCNGETDEAGAIGTAAWYPDVDGDSYGTTTGAISACSAPTGFVSIAGDCDDTMPTVSPAETETCNAIDDDCDGETDEEGATGEVTWYPDVDEDSYGTTIGETSACSAPTGFTSIAGDCDDTTPTVSPAETETCNAIDDDCDGETDEEGATGEVTWYPDVDEDSYGTTIGETSACSAPTGFVSMAGDCDDSDHSSYPGGIEVMDDGIDQDCSGADLLSATYTGSEPGWYHANYDGGFGDYDSAVGYDGTISCPATCLHYGKEAVGARFVCNTAYGMTGDTEGCTPSTDGMYGTANCGLMVRDMVTTTESGSTEDCAGGDIWGCATSSCSEYVTWHAVECQCI